MAYETKNANSDNSVEHYEHGIPRDEGAPCPLCIQDIDGLKEEEANLLNILGEKLLPEEVVRLMADESVVASLVKNGWAVCALDLIKGKAKRVGKTPEQVVEQLIQEKSVNYLFNGRDEVPQKQ